MIVETGDNEQQTVSLPDGSTVYLNERSRIAYSDDFPARFVQMNGEAFFDVVRDETLPFEVQSGPGRARVLGIAFAVRYRAGEPEIQVTVATGRVAVLSAQADSAVIIDPGYRGTVQTRTGVLGRTVNDDATVLSWLARPLVFEETPLPAVIATLQAHFATAFEVVTEQSDALSACTFTGTFDTPDLSEVLDALSFTLGVDITRVEGVYRLVGNGCIPVSSEPSVP